MGIVERGVRWHSFLDAGQQLSGFCSLGCRSGHCCPRGAEAIVCAPSIVLFLLVSLSSLSACWINATHTRS